MVDKELLERIADAACGADELADFCANLDEREYDLDGSFQKYYRLGRILHAIERFERGEIDVDYLTIWAIVYNRIIMATKWAKTDYSGLVGFEEYLIETISETLDSLSFLDSMNAEEEYAEQLEGYKDEFRFYDHVLSTLGEWDVSYAVGVTREDPEDAFPEEDDGDDDDDDETDDEFDEFDDEFDELHASFLAVNESKKLFEQFFSSGYRLNEARMKERKITPEEMTEKIAALKDAGYREPTV